MKIVKNMQRKVGKIADIFYIQVCLSNNMNRFSK